MLYVHYSRTRHKYIHDMNSKPSKPQSSLQPPCGVKRLKNPKLSNMGTLNHVLHCFCQSKFPQSTTTTQQNHPHQLLIKTIMQLITNTTYKVHIKEVKAHNNIQGTEIVDNLSKKKEGSTFSIVSPIPIIHTTHTTLYW